MKYEVIREEKNNGEVRFVIYEVLAGSKEELCSRGSLEEAKKRIDQEIQYNFNEGIKSNDVVFTKEVEE